MRTLVIKNATVVTNSAILPETDVLVKDGKIAALGSHTEIPQGAEVLDAAGEYLLAGFIDLHVHGGGGADFMDATPAAFETAVQAHLAHGTTLLYPTAMAASHEALCDFLAAYRGFLKESPLAPLAPGVHFEGPYFFGATQASRGAQNAGALRLPDMEEVDTLLTLADGAILRWDASPELAGACEFAAHLRERGIVAAIAHTDATAEEARRGFESGFSHVTHFYNATSMHRKREQTVYAGVVEATYLDDGVTVELIGDGCHIPREDMYLALKIKGAEKVSVITDGTRISGTDLTCGKLGSLSEGTEVIVEAGVAKLPDRSSFAGSIATMDRCLRVLVSDYGIDLPTASVMLSLAPALCMGVADQKGSIAVGKDADLVLVTHDFLVKTVIVGGHVAVHTA
ncbi:MAG: N-acetylglucosamine-6-phosphate deacetylase [Clostridia bacterium]|nr:N-acetylglucosamine-6-phosphate deacetylase [Clostridia bacterium]